MARINDHLVVQSVQLLNGDPAAVLVDDNSTREEIIRLDSHSVQNFFGELKHVEDDRFLFRTEHLGKTEALQLAFWIGYFYANS